MPEEAFVTMVEEPATPPATDPREDGRTRCTWVAGRPEHYAFHDAEFGMIPDTDDLARERVFLAALMRDVPLVEVLDRRQDLWETFKGYDVKALDALDDAWLAVASAKGGLFADRARLTRLQSLARAVASTAREYKDFREYLLAVRFLTAEEQFAEMTSRFPGFEKQDAANLMELCGLVEGMPHERDCWRA